MNDENLLYKPEGFSSPFTLHHSPFTIHPSLFYKFVAEEAPHRPILRLYRMLRGKGHPARLEMAGGATLVRLHLAAGLTDDVVKLLVRFVVWNFLCLFRSGYDEKHHAGFNRNLYVYGEPG